MEVLETMIIANAQLDKCTCSAQRRSFNRMERFNPSSSKHCSNIGYNIIYNDNIEKCNIGNCIASILTCEHFLRKGQCSFQNCIIM